MCPNSEEHVERATQGDRAALTELLELEGPAVRRVVEAELPKRFQSLLSADDVMQQTYADAFLGIERFVPRGEGAFRAWLTRLAKRNLVDAVRMLSAEKRGGDRRRVDAHALEESYAALYEVVQRTLSTPSRQVASREARAALDDALAKLPEHYAKVVRMYDLEGRPIEEVADSLGRRVGATYMLRSRAHDRLGVLMGSASQFFTAGG
jgi:RNA polymerase sigma factor (sigma-70 family)